MRDDWIPETPELYQEFLSNLMVEREGRKRANISKKKSRRNLTRVKRETILKKTDGKCHICGGVIEDKWEADHVLAHSGGGMHSVDNYLPAHKMCNNYRWDYLPDEFQEILRLGVWLRTQIQNKREIGLRAAEYFIDYEKRRIGRRKNKL